MESPVDQQHTPLREHYDHHGYVIARDILDDALIQEARSHIEWLLARNPGTRPEQLHHTLMTDDPFWVRLVSDDRMLEVAQQFVGPDIALFASHYIAKRPFDGQAVLWHQDGSYWPLEPMEVVTLWLALDDSDAENGCLRVLPGTHTTALQTMQARTDVDSVLGSGLDDSMVAEADAVDLVLAPGDLSVHHPNIVYGSNANHSPRWRRGLTIRYIPTSVRILGGEPASPFPSAFLLRGEARPGINRYNFWPAFVGGRHMPFRQWEEWNQHCERVNARQAARSG